MKFSIIIPTYNSEKYIKRCLDSIISQQPSCYSVEVLLIDDCSTDNTYQIIKEFKESNNDWVKIFKSDKNGGPGLTRNIGIENLSGEWLLFLDSDDKLSPNALKELSQYIYGEDNRLEVVGYNWAYDSNSDVKSERYGGRWDLSNLLKSKDDIIREYVSLGMDSSVIYTAIKKSLFDDYKVRFREGVHEDVDFMLKAYFYADKNGVLDLPLYVKNNRKNSIVNSISESHIKGFLGALKEIYAFLNSQHVYEENSKYYYHGLLRVVATQVRSICKECGSADCADKLYSILHNEYTKLLKSCGAPQFRKKDFFKTKYIMIADYFFNLMASAPKSVHKSIADFLDDIKDKQWSCYSLHHSLFLAPEEIRTCCKRFFVNNEIKGDVVILKEDKYSYEEFTPENILKEKRNLHVRINRGTAEECIGCPYLEFKNWQPINELKIEYISFEYSSVCNMRCSYCSDDYYGGKNAKYNVEMLLKNLFEQKSLQYCNTIVWGGGEITLDNSFDKLLTFMATNFPNVKQRVFTNATKFSGVINKYLKEGNILSITSTDAGTEENFYRIRKHSGFREVFKNLKSYSACGPENMIIKYIITEENKTFQELRSFVHCIKEHSLEGCNFQISFDFKKEFVDFDSLISAIALFTYLSDKNVRYIFFDDLLWQRVSGQLNKDYHKVLQELQRLNLLRAFADRKKYKKVVVWGAGTQAKFLIEKSEFFKEVEIDYIVDNSSEKIGKDFFGYKVLDPKALLNSDCPILIAAVQNVPKILENFYELGVDQSRLIKDIVI